jgi:Tfp pilus assembly protein PilF
MRVGWLVIGVLGLVPSVARGQTATHDAPDPAPARSSKMSSHAGNALASGSPAQAAILAQQALNMDALNAWAHYRRAAALGELHRTDDAVKEFKVAEQAFASVDDRGQSLSIYGRAHALAEAGRCPEAGKVFEEYAQFVEKKDPKGAAQARSYASCCHGTATEQTAQNSSAPPPAPAKAAP